jgi:hypothetical protein
MAIYEKRTYDFIVGHMPEATRLFNELGWPALENGGFDKKCVGFFVSDTGSLHQVMHLWRFDDDADRRAHFARLYADEKFMEFALQIRTHILNQDVQLLNSAPWGPQP